MMLVLIFLFLIVALSFGMLYMYRLYIIQYDENKSKEKIISFYQSNESGRYTPMPKYKQNNGEIRAVLTDGKPYIMLVQYYETSKSIKETIPLDIDTVEQFIYGLRSVEQHVKDYQALLAIEE
jgi:hypothetical protein